MSQDATEQHSPRPDTTQSTEAGDLAGLPLSHKMATLQFFDSSDPKWVIEKPFYSNVPFVHSKTANTNVTPTEAVVPIFNVRGHESRFTLDQNGFELVKWNHGFSDLGPSFQVKGYPAVTKFMKDTLGHHV